MKVLVNNASYILLYYVCLVSRTCCNATMLPDRWRALPLSEVKDLCHMPIFISCFVTALDHGTFCARNCSLFTSFSRKMPRALLHPAPCHSQTAFILFSWKNISRVTSVSWAEQRSWTSSFRSSQDIDFDGGYNGSMIKFIARNNVFCVLKENQGRICL